MADKDEERSSACAGVGWGFEVAEGFGVAVFAVKSAMCGSLRFDMEGCAVFRPSAERERPLDAVVMARLKSCPSC